MTKYQFLVRMATNVFVVELAIKLRVDGHGLFVLLRPHVREICASCFLVCFALLRETLDPEELGVRVSFGPVGDEDVVLKVHSSHIGDVVAKLFDGGADLRGEGGRGEDS